MKIGWVQDYGPERIGGADLSRKWLMAAAPTWAEVRLCTPEHFDPTCDGYIFVAGMLASREQLEIVANRPCVATPRDLWETPGGGSRHVMLQEILNRARRVILMSPLHVRLFAERYLIPGKVELCISAFNPNPFIGAREKMPARSRNLWVGDFNNPYRGLKRSADWCIARGETLDALGYAGSPPGWSAAYASHINYLAPVPYAEMPEVYEHYSRVVLLMTGLDPCGRVAMEATLAGRELIADPAWCGVMSYDWWPEAAERPRLLAGHLLQAPGRFWRLVEGALWSS